MRMLLLTNCEVHTGKYLDRSFEVRTEQTEVRTKTRVQIFPVWTSQLVNNMNSSFFAFLAPVQVENLKFFVFPLIWLKFGIGG